VAGGERTSGHGPVLPLNPHNYGSFSLLWWRRVDYASYHLFMSPSLEFLDWLPSSLPQA
jgi:muconolactone delta-isomerase